MDKLNETNHRISKINKTKEELRIMLIENKFLNNSPMKPPAIIARLFIKVPNPFIKISNYYNKKHTIYLKSK